MPGTTKLRNLKNADITNIIEQMMPRLVDLLVLKKAFDRNAELQLNENIDALIGTSSIEELNSKYADLMGYRGVLISIPGNATPEDREAIFAAAKLHISSIVGGFTQVSARSFSHRRENTIREVHHHHYHGCRDNFWRDLMLYDLLFNSNRDTCHHHSRPTSSTNSSKKEDNQVTLAGILLAVCMIGGALATAGYDVMQTYQRVDEIVHGEDVLGNTAKLSVTAFAGFSGYLLGAMIGASCFANPILGGICLAFITAAAGMAAAKWLVGKIHGLDNNESASLTDPRFCLTKKEEQRLIKQGLNPEVAKELLRECSMAIGNEPSNGLVFWQNPHKEIIAIARKVKAGTIEEVVTMDMTHKVIHRMGANAAEKVTLSKEFNLKKPVELCSAVMEADNADNNVSGYFTASSEKSPLLASNFYSQHNNSIPSAPPAFKEGDEYCSNLPMATATLVG